MKLMSINSDPANKMKVIALFCFVLFQLLMSCSTVSIPMRDSVESYTVTLERTACRGNCPVYAFTVNGDGTVEYEGYLNSPFQGKKIGVIPKDSVSALIRAIESVNIDDLQPMYVQQSTTDMPSVIFTVQHMRNGIIRGKKILDYQGDATAPKSLRLLYDRIDAWYSIIQWQ